MSWRLQEAIGKYLTDAPLLHTDQEGNGLYTLISFIFLFPGLTPNECALCILGAIELKSVRKRIENSTEINYIASCCLHQSNQNFEGQDNMSGHRTELIIVCEIAFVRLSNFWVICHSLHSHMHAVGSDYTAFFFYFFLADRVY